MSSPTRTFTLTCHCRTATLSFTTLLSALPLPVHFCHCTVCRHTHGTLCTMHARIPAPVVDLAVLTAYKSSERVVRWFCGRCGAHVLDRAGSGEGEEWYVAAALVDAEEDIWAFGSSIFMGSTGDGGLGGVMGKVGERAMEMWRGREGGEIWEPAAPSPIPPPHAEDADTAPRGKDGEKEDREGEELHLRCHCGAIHLSVSRPPSAAVFNDMDASLVPRDTSKWYALHDACDSCRLTSSSALVSWLFPLRRSVSVYLPSPTTSSSTCNRTPYPSSGVFASAKTYTSSPGVTRTFCGTCGATVSYATQERGEMVDLAAGLVVVEGEFEMAEGVNGVRAEDWLEWREGRVAFEEDARWKGAVGAVVRGRGR